jgi:hypothetical protein
MRLPRSSPLQAEPNSAADRGQTKMALGYVERTMLFNCTSLLFSEKRRLDFTLLTKSKNPKSVK